MCIRDRFTSSRRKDTNFARAVSNLVVCICGCSHPRRTVRISWPSAENRSTPTQGSRGLPPVMIPCWRIKFHGLLSGTACKNAISAMRTGTIWTCLLYTSKKPGKWNCHSKKPPVNSLVDASVDSRLTGKSLIFGAFLSLSLIHI